jgi:cation diffusion facilitator family transporter
VENERLYRKEGIYSIVLNGILFGAKLIVGTMSGSVAIIADGWHSMSDSLSSIVVLVSSKISAVPPDKKHPYGHGRIETIASVIVSMMLFLVSYEFIKKAVVNYINSEEVVFGTAAYIVTIASVIVKEILVIYSMRIYKITKSKMMKAEAMHHRSDSLSSAAVLAGIIVGKFFWWIDSALSIIISLMIAYTAYKIIRDTVSSLLGEAPGQGEIDLFKEIIRKAVGFDLYSHHFHIHSYGDHKELTFHIRLDGELSLNQTHCITEKIEKDINDKTGYFVTIHPEDLREREDG